MERGSPTPVGAGLLSCPVQFRTVSTPRISVLYVTDLAYPARGRRYCDEDIVLTSRLREHLDVALCHPLDVVALMDSFDVIVVRNSGPVIHYADQFDEFVARAHETGAQVFTELRGKADQIGKQYLPDLFSAGYPVTPTVDVPDQFHLLPEVAQYAVKPKLGADSVGLRFLDRDEVVGLDAADWEGMLVQPRIDFVHEVSFYFVDHDFQYALYAPDPERRWELQPYEATEADLDFARRFIEWNDIEHGIQRVDACRTHEGDLLLVELEDLNPYLSLDRVDAGTATAFVNAMAVSIGQLAAGSTSRSSRA